jgi:hypothetical protein
MSTINLVKLTKEQLIDLLKEKVEAIKYEDHVCDFEDDIQKIIYTLKNCAFEGWEKWED